MENQISQETMSARDIAVYLGISPQTAYTLLHSQGFPGFRVRKRLLVRKVDLEAWLHEQRERGVSA